jgi:hypothetical protein
MGFENDIIQLLASTPSVTRPPRKRFFSCLFLTVHSLCCLHYLRYFMVSLPFSRSPTLSKGGGEILMKKLDNDTRNQNVHVEEEKTGR